jgi:uncharacterized alkaline shock family protein YloU
MINFIKTLLWGLISKKVYGLIGPTGTGKSFKAYLLVDKYKIDYIIDDGLLIKDQKIIAGKSAKQEPLRIKAVKIAIFYETRHAREVRKKLFKERFRSLLIIATSERMLKKIIEGLHLPKPVKIIRIEDISTKEEIRKAKRSRFKEGKHVVPVPLVEVKKNYSNIILHAIHLILDESKGFFFKKRNKKIIEKTIVRPNYGGNGTISISESAIIQMIDICLSDYHNVKLLKANIIERDEGYYFKINIAVSFNSDSAKIIKEIQNKVKYKIEDFTGITISRIDINISEISYNSN